MSSKKTVKNIAWFIMWLAIEFLILALIIILNDLVASYQSEALKWLVPFLAAIVLVSIGCAVWYKIKEVEILKHEFTSMTMHKFKTSLSHIKWASEELAKSNLAQADRVELNEIISANRQLVELVDLAVESNDSKTYSYNFKKYSVQDILFDVLRLNQAKARSRAVTIMNKVPTSPFMVRADSPRLRFVFQTIIENAIKYTRSGGELRIEAGVRGHKVIITFADSGIGISKRDLASIFSKFFRSENSKRIDADGMGIGLYLSRNILERHDGSIKVESEGENKGSIFIVTLPLA